MHRSIWLAALVSLGVSPLKAVAISPKPPKVVAFVIAAVVLAQTAAADRTVVSDELVANLTGHATSNFWGRAVLSSGQPVQRPPDYDPRTPIIPIADSRRVVEGALPVGVAMWCGVEWRPYYLGFMRTEPAKRWSEVQVAYIGVLFGLAQQTIASSLASDSGGSCTPD